MDENVENLLKLIRENPNLPVIPVVYSDVCWGDYDSYLGSFGKAFVTSFATIDDKFVDDAEEYKELYYLSHCDDDEFQNISPEETEILLDEVATKSMRKAILVYVCPFED